MANTGVKKPGVSRKRTFNRDVTTKLNQVDINAKNKKIK